MKSVEENEMASVEVSLAAAVAVLGVNMVADSPHKQSGVSRTLRAAALAGSAAAGDSEVSILAGATEIARIFNSTTGFPTRDHLKGIQETIPANQELSVIVVDAPATNPLNIHLELT